MAASDAYTLAAAVTQTFQQGADAAQPGPMLQMHMGEAALIERLNAWGSAKDRDILALRADLLATQVGVSGAFSQAQETVQGIVWASSRKASTMPLSPIHF